MLQAHPSLLQKHCCGVTNAVYNIETAEASQALLGNFSPVDEKLRGGQGVATAFLDPKLLMSTNASLGDTLGIADDEQTGPKIPSVEYKLSSG